jgi:hypothetical protein
MNRRIALLAGGLLLAGLGLAGPADAGPRQARKEPQQISNAQLHEALNVLQVTKKMLEGADHDYGGHRVNAIKAIGAAQRQLKLALQSQGKKAVKPANPGNKGAKSGKGRGKEPEPQAISNLQLADAIGILQRTVVLLENANHDYGGHRAAAVRDLNGAFEKKTGK